MAEFFKFYRKKGVAIMLKTLKTLKNFTIKQSIFYKTLQESALNHDDFNNAKSELQDLSLIGYKIDEEEDKVIFLTPKGLKFCNIIEKLEDLINSKVINE
jgi:predicted transcriptional regulator